MNLAGLTHLIKRVENLLNTRLIKHLAYHTPVEIFNSAPKMAIADCIRRLKGDGIYEFNM